jgi:hypothetical protein
MQEGTPVPPGATPPPADIPQPAPAQKKSMPVWVRILFGIAGIIAIISGLYQIFGGGHNVNYGKDNIIYYHDATRSDADLLAKALQTDQYFGSNANGVSVLLDKKGDAITISFVFPDDKAGDTTLMKTLHDIAIDVTKSVPGKLTTIRIVDPDLNEKQSVGA